MQGFVADCTEHFARMQKKQSWADTDYRNGAEAMAAILEVMRRHEVRACPLYYMSSMRQPGPEISGRIQVRGGQGIRISTTRLSPAMIDPIDMRARSLVSGQVFCASASQVRGDCIKWRH